MRALRVSLAAIGAAAALAAIAAAAAPASAVDAGALRARIADLWRVDFVARSGEPVVAEARATADGAAGTLGFRTGDGWARATHVVGKRREGGALVLDVATTDPQGRRLAVRVDPVAPGAIRLSARVADGAAEGVRAVGIAFEARPGERYLGFGERSNAVDQRGEEVQSYVAEGPFQVEERPFATALVPPSGYRPRDDATYFPMPWLLSTAGYGALVEGYDEVLHRLGSDDPGTWGVEALTDSLELTVFAGPTPAKALRRMTARVGRQPSPAAPWFFGPWFQTGQENHVPLDREREYLRLLRAGDAPVSVAETHRRYLPCGAADSAEAREQERARARFFDENGLATLTYFNPMICVEYERAYAAAQQAGVLLRNRNGAPYSYLSYVGERAIPLAPVGQIDFTAPGAQAFFDGLLDEALADGHDGWMEDFGEYTPTDAVAANGATGAALHNRYVVDYHCAGWAYARRAPRPLARFVRSGYTGVAPCAQIVWGGDPTTGWGFDGLGSAMTNGLTMGLSGIALWGSDIGGFHSFGFNELTPELLIRWIQFGAVSGVMRTKADGFALPDRTRPQIWEPPILPQWRRWARFHTQLYPYLAAGFAEYRRTGMPIMRHLALVAPGDPHAVRRDDEFLFGPDLLAAPVTAPGAETTHVYLPRGRWVDLWRSVRYRDRRGDLRLGEVRALRGRREVVLPAPLDELPLLVRAGAVIPMLPPAVETLAGGKRARGVVTLRERRRAMRLLAFPRGRSRGALGPGEPVRSRVRRHAWQLAIHGERRRRYRLQASLDLLRRPLRPCAVSVAGRRLRESAWEYSARTGVLRARFAIRRGRLTVERC